MPDHTDPTSVTLEDRADRALRTAYAGEMPLDPWVVLLKAALAAEFRAVAKESVAHFLDSQEFNLLIGKAQDNGVIRGLENAAKICAALRRQDRQCLEGYDGHDDRYCGACENMIDAYEIAEEKICACAMDVGK